MLSTFLVTFYNIKFYNYESGPLSLRTWVLKGVLDLQKWDRVIPYNQFKCCPNALLHMWYLHPWIKITLTKHAYHIVMVILCLLCKIYGIFSEDKISVLCCFLNEPLPKNGNIQKKLFAVNVLKF